MSDDLKAADEGEGDTGVTHEEILDALRARADWESQLETWEQMRDEGVRRVNKPWPNAADMHFPLADMQVEKNKPLYLQQIYASELIAAFTPTKRGAQATATASAQWFDHQVKQRSNFEDIAPILVDRFCQNGRAVCRVRWDAKRKRLDFEVPRPQDIIVPSWTKPLHEADWIVLVQTYSKAAYRRAGLFSADKGLMERIAGGPKENDSAQSETKDYRRAGITHSDAKDEIVVWVVHERCGDRWKVKTYSPKAKDEPLRADFYLPYTKGDFAEGAPPFVAFSYEVKDELFLGARGICKKIAPFEASLNSDWNTIKDHQRLSCQPVLQAPGGLKNAGNIRFRPGDILPFEVSKVDFGSVPNDLRQGMVETRQTAEALLATPDFGVGGMKNPGGNKTATEVQAIGNLAAPNIEMRARIFRRELARLLRLAWALLCQYAGENRDYRYRDELSELDARALDEPDAYAIEPSASGDSFTREQRIQKAQWRFQTFKGDPFIDQGELRKDLLECDSPGLVKKLWRSPEDTAAAQTEAQAVEITMMMTVGFPAAVEPQDDDATHLACLGGFLERRSALKEPVNEEQTLLLAQHAQAHAAALKQKNPQALGQFKELLDALGRLGQAAQQSMQRKQQAAQQGGQQQPTQAGGDARAPAGGADAPAVM